MTLSDRINDVAMKLANRASHSDDRQLCDLAYDLSSIAQELEGFGPLEASERFPTPRQGLALARFLQRMQTDEFASVTKGGHGLDPDKYLLVQLSDGYTGGIDLEGRVST